MGNSKFTVYSLDIRYDIRSNISIRSNGKSIDVTGVWDTGATRSCVSHNVIKQLSPPKGNSIITATPSGRSKQNTYTVNVELPNQVEINDLVVIDTEIGSQGFDMLIGMDVISQGDFAISNYKGQTIFTFRTPSKGHIDFMLE